MGDGDENGTDRQMVSSATTLKRATGFVCNSLVAATASEPNARDRQWPRTTQTLTEEESLRSTSYKSSLLCFVPNSAIVVPSGNKSNNVPKTPDGWDLDLVWLRNRSHSHGGPHEVGILMPPHPPPPPMTHRILPYDQKIIAFARCVFWNNTSPVSWEHRKDVES